MATPAKSKALFDKVQNLATEGIGGSTRNLYSLFGQISSRGWNQPNRQRVFLGQ